MFEINGEFFAKYTLDGKHRELHVEVKLFQIDETKELYRNIWEGKAWVDEKPYNHPDLKHCVNARLMAESIGRDEIEKLRQQYKKEGKNFRLKHNKDDNTRRKSNKKTVPADKEGVQRRTKKMGKTKSGSKSI